MLQPNRAQYARSMPPSMKPKQFAGLTTASTGAPKMSPTAGSTFAMPAKWRAHAATISPPRSRKWNVTSAISTSRA